MNNENLNTIEEQMKKKIFILRRWEYEYYILDNPSVEDYVYDSVFNELKDLENKYNLVLPDSPTNKLNSKIYSESKLKLIKRDYPMLSIDNVNNLDGLLNFDKRVKKDLKKDHISYLCELKIDGLSASLIYKDKKLFQISTRGDGFFGEDVTSNHELIEDFPLSLERDYCEVRGEIYMRKDEFAHINKEILKKGLKKLSNPRNAAAGTLRTLIPSKDRRLNFFAYQYFLPEIKSQNETLARLKDDGFSVSEYRFCENINEVWEYAKCVELKRDKINFSIDGIVVKIDNHDDQKKLGENNKFPRWAIAYKFSSQQIRTIVKEINTEVSKNGRISYVAAVEPTLLDGSVISNVTLHNFSFIKNKLIDINDEIIIKKAGDVIPQVYEVIKKENIFSHWNPPSKCSSCFSDLSWNDNNLYQICYNKDCEQRNINYLTFFASKSAANMKGISNAIVEKLYKSFLVRRPYEFYYLKNKREDLAKIETFKEKTIENIINSIENSRHQDLSNFIASFSIPLLSYVKAKKFSSLFDNNSKSLLEFIKNLDFELVEKELGKKTRESLDLFFSDELNLENFEKTIVEMIF